MLFNSIQFLFFFIAVVLIVAALRQRYYQHTFLLIASYYFYWVSGEILILIMVFLTIFTFYCGGKIFSERGKNKKLFLAAAIVVALATLGFFKYFNFGISTFNALVSPAEGAWAMSVAQVALPIGISFYTFHALSYIFDIYLGKIEPSKTLTEYALYIAFFPQLVAGPIVRAREFLPQLRKNVTITPENVRFGLTLMSVGIIKKVVIADNIAYYVDLVFSNPSVPIQQTSSFFIIAGTILFGIQIFADFSGYIDIALGCAKILGFELPQNFNRPYLSANPTEFWRRWNITLSSFIRDYLYIPLGGNRKGKIRTYANLMVSMTLCGLWHGAAWNFVIWGIYHGVLLSLHKFSLDIRARFSFLKKSARTNAGAVVNTDSQFGVRDADKEPAFTLSLVARILVTQYFIFLGWLIFRVHNLSDVIYCVQKFVFIDFSSITAGLTKYTDIIQTNAVLLVAGALVIAIVFRNRIRSGGISQILSFDYVEYLQKVDLKYWACFMMGCILLLLCLSPSASPEFIYFQF